MAPLKMVEGIAVVLWEDGFVRFLIGHISTMPEHAKQHPEEVLEEMIVAYRKDTGETNGRRPDTDI